MIKKPMTNKKFFLLPILILTLFLSACASQTALSDHTDSNVRSQISENGAADLQSIPAYDGEPYIPVHNNLPFFEESDYTLDAFESYSDLDALGRCGTAYANICPELMPTEERGNIGQIKPSGWQTCKYDQVEGKYLYNRCHLIGFQLAGENANEKNLITGTRYFNVQGMLPFENMVADYVKETENHVLYRVTPVFESENLVASGALLEAWSVEDEGDGICFCVYVYNVQPGIVIDYATGESSEAPADSSLQNEEDGVHYVLNTSSHKFHLPDCSGAASIKPENREDSSASRDSLIREGYSPCGRCNP